MPRHTLMSYNIENMNRMFKGGAVKPSYRGRAGRIAQVIQHIDPDLLGICEAANEAAEHQHFIQNYLPNSGYSVAQGKSRGSQNLVFYYRSPFEVVGNVDDAFDFYSDRQRDLEEDGISEIHRWTRRPLETVFEIGAGGPHLRAIMVHAKSKGIFTAVDLHRFQELAVANRKRLAGQALQLRDRLNQLIQGPNALPVVVMGDMNDGPGFDAFEKMVGKSFVETVMGSVYEPDGIFHNTLRWMSRTRATEKELWTVEFPDPIVSAAFGKKHRVWLDHILASPDMLEAGSQITCVADSGRIEKDDPSKDASDHFPVAAEIETD